LTRVARNFAKVAANFAKVGHNFTVVAQHLQIIVRNPAESLPHFPVEAPNTPNEVQRIGSVECALKFDSVRFFDILRHRAQKTPVWRVQIHPRRAFVAIFDAADSRLPSFVTIISAVDSPGGVLSQFSRRLIRFHGLLLPLPERLKAV